MAYNNGHEVGPFRFSYYTDFSHFQLHIAIDEKQWPHFENRISTGALSNIHADAGQTAGM